MKKIDRYITTNFIKSVFLALFGFIGIFILSQLFKIIRYVSEGRFSGVDSIFYTVSLLPDIIIKVAPLAILLGGLMTVNKMASNLEIIALKTSGISFRRIVMFPVIISFVISLGVYYMYDEVYPKSIIKSREIKRGTVEDRSLPKTKANAFLRGNGNYLYKAKLIDRVNSRAEYFQVVELDENFEEIEKVVNAKSADYDREENYWVLKDVKVNLVNEEKIEEYDEYISLDYVDEPELFLTPKVEIKEMTVKELKEVLTLIKRTGGSSVEILAEIANRRAFPFASFVVSFLGLALGSRYIRGANAVSIAMSVALGYGYYILQASLEAIALSGIIHPFVAFWLPNVIFLGIGIYSMNKAEY